MNAIAAIFVNKSEKRMRAGWRLLIHFFGFAISQLAAALTAQAIADRAASETVFGILYIAFGLGFTWLMARFIDRRAFSAYGLHLNSTWWGDFIFGLALGVVLMSGIVAAMIYAGWATLSEEAVTNLGVPIMLAFGVKVLMMIAVGINEEVAFRGYQLKNISEGFSRFGANTAVIIALIISSSIFGLAHLGNELGGGAHTTQLALFNLIIAGLMLAIPYLITGELAVSIGIHITWNLFQGPVFGLPVSGLQDETRLITVQAGGPEFWTGGDYGPEGGLLASIAIVVSIIVSALWVKLRGRRVGLHPDIATYTPRA